MIDELVFEAWLGTFGNRLGKDLDPHAVAAYYTALSREMDTAMFERAALRVFERHTFNTWPAPIEFIAAAAAIRREPDAEIRQTQRLLAADAAIPRPTRDVVDQFAGDWRATLAHCRPDPIDPSPAAQPTAPTDPWSTDERRGERAVRAPRRTDAVESAQDAEADAALGVGR